MEKIVIITGGNKGLGQGLSKVYHKNGYRVFSISRTVKEKFYQAEQYSCDLSKTETIAPTLTKLFSHLDTTITKKILLINNAGDLGTVNTLENLNAIDINYTININLIAPLILNATFIKLTQGFNCEKEIINISSGAAKNPYDGWSLYCTSKAGIDMMTKVIAKEQNHIEKGVKTVSIYPGIVDTDMQSKVRNTPKENFRSVQRFIDFYEHGQLLSPKFVAEKIYDLDHSGKLKSGKIIDIRDIE